MTVSDPGAGQQQGREVCDCGHGGISHNLSSGASGAPTFCLEHDCTCPRFAPSPTPPARDSGRDAAREAVARWLWEQDGYAGSWEREDQQDYYREDADRLLALPELDKLLRRPA